MSLQQPKILKFLENIENFAICFYCKNDYNLLIIIIIYWLYILNIYYIL